MSHLWGCSFHWRNLPRKFQAAIWRHYTPGQEKTGEVSQGWRDADEAARKYSAEVESLIAAASRPAPPKLFG